MSLLCWEPSQVLIMPTGPTGIADHWLPPQLLLWPHFLPLLPSSCSNALAVLLTCHADSLSRALCLLFLQTEMPFPQFSKVSVQITKFHLLREALPDYTMLKTNKQKAQPDHCFSPRPALLFSIAVITTWHTYFFFILSLPLLECQWYASRDSILSTVTSLEPKPVLAHSRQSVNICWINQRALIHEWRMWFDLHCNNGIHQIVRHLLMGSVLYKSLCLYHTFYI